MTASLRKTKCTLTFEFTLFAFEERRSFPTDIDEVSTHVDTWSLRVYRDLLQKPIEPAGVMRRDGMSNPSSRKW